MDTSLQPYRFKIFKPLYYSFVTESGIEYNCYFTPYGEYFKKYPTIISSKFYAFNLELLNNKLKPKGKDKRIADTVISIVGDFLNSQINAVVYICDNSDGRESTRARKFLSWYDYYTHPSHQVLQVTGDMQIGNLKLYTALLIHKKNKLKKKLIEAYIDLIDYDSHEK